MLKKLPKIKLPYKILISAIIIGFLLLQMDATTLKHEMEMVHASAWVYALLFIIAQLLILSVRWMYLINIGRHRMNYSDSVQLTLASLIANMMFVTSISGIVVRITMAFQYGASLFKAIFATAIDRLMTLAALIFLSVIFLPSLASYVEAPLFNTISLFIAVMMLVMFVFTPLITLAILHKMPQFKLSKGNLRSGSRYLTLLFSNNVLLVKILVISLVAQFCFFAAVYCISVSAGIELSFWQIMVVLPAIALVSSMPFSFGGWGLREGAFVYGLGLLAVPMETAFSISVQIGLISLIATIIAGLPALLSNDIFKLKKKQPVRIKNSDD